jgi:hypothetical protein
MRRLAVVLLLGLVSICATACSSGSPGADDSQSAVAVNAQHPCDPGNAGYNPTSCGVSSGSGDQSNPAASANASDSQNQCDPTSSLYDPAGCASTPNAAGRRLEAPASSSDTHDPCDPASSVYDPFACGNANTSGQQVTAQSVARSTDSLDPCDPQSYLYQPGNPQCARQDVGQAPAAAGAQTRTMPTPK